MRKLAGLVFLFHVFNATAAFGALQVTTKIPTATAVTHNFVTAISPSTVTQAQPVCADLSNAAASCSTDATNASNIGSGTLPAGRLPNPSSSSLGGTQSIAAVTHNFLTSISTSGVPAQAQPACADLSNAATSCSTDATNAANISSGVLVSARLPYAPPTVQKFTSGSSTYNKDYTFVITSGNATAAATYTNNAVTFTVYATVASATQVVMSGSGAPAASGTLTKASGTGDSTLTFSQFLAPIALEVKAVGAGGGGGGSGTTAGTAATNGGDTTFGSSLITAGGGVKGAEDANGGAGGTSSLGTSVGLNPPGGAGGASDRQGTSPLTSIPGGSGGNSAFGGGGFGGAAGQTGAGGAGGTNSGGGGGGGYCGTTTSCISGSGGGSGGYVDAFISAPSATYSYSVGTAGSGQAAGTNGAAGGAGGSGVVMVVEYYQ